MECKLKINVVGQVLVKMKVRSVPKREQFPSPFTMNGSLAEAFEAFATVYTYCQFPTCHQSNASARRYLLAIAFCILPARKCHPFKTKSQYRDLLLYRLISPGGEFTQPRAHLIAELCSVSRFSQKTCMELENQSASKKYAGIYLFRGCLRKPHLGELGEH